MSTTGTPQLDNRVAAGLLGGSAGVPCGVCVGLPALSASASSRGTLRQAGSLVVVASRSRGPGRHSGNGRTSRGPGISAL